MKKVSHFDRITRAMAELTRVRELSDNLRPADPNQAGWKEPHRMHIVATPEGFQQVAEQLRAARAELDTALTALREFEAPKPKTTAKARAR